MTKNENVRVRVVCKENCGWLVFVSDTGGTKRFLVKTVNMTHTCMRTYHNSAANTEWVSKKVMAEIRRDQNYKAKTIVNKIGEDHMVGISLCKAQRARKRALNLLIGSLKDQYAMLWKYCAELRRVCPSNTTKMDVRSFIWSPAPIFQKIYICLDACKKGFLSTCRPFIGVDGCFLKGQYGGQMLTAVGNDPNNNYFLIAWAIVDVENKENWKWFISLLLEDLGTVRENKWVFMSDQQKGLCTVFDELLDGWEHRFCVRHLYNNFKKRWAGGEFHKLMEAAARATYKALCEKNMADIKKLDSEAYNFLMGIPKSAWTRHAFHPHPETDQLLNNICESFNAQLISARDKGLLALLEFTRIYVMNRFVENIDKVSRYNGNIMPKIKKKLDVNIVACGEWIARAAGYNRYEVTHGFGKQHVVNLSEKCCSCQSFQLSDIPCSHAIRAMHFIGARPEEFVSRRYSREAYIACYSPPMSPINESEMCPETNENPLLPPPLKKRPGRPKKLRRREPSESANIANQGSRKLSQKHFPTRCGNCGELGHNRRTCTLGKSRTHQEVIQSD